MRINDHKRSQSGIFNYNKNVSFVKNLNTDYSHFNYLQLHFLLLRGSFVIVQKLYDFSFSGDISAYFIMMFFSIRPPQKITIVYRRFNCLFVEHNTIVFLTYWYR